MMTRFFRKHQVFLQLIPYIFVLLGLFIVYLGFMANKAQTERNRQAGLVSQTYNRSTNCFLAVPAEQRTDGYIKSCYDKAEAATGVTITRYGAAKE